MKKPVLFVFLCSFCLSQLAAQRPAGRSGGSQPAGRFYGKVVDASNKGVDAATVTLVQQRTDTATKQTKEVVVGGMLTSANGEFNIENVPAFGRYTLRITGIGYKTVEKPVQFGLGNRNGGNADVNAMAEALDKDLGNIRLDIDDKLLGNVTVTTSAKPLLQLGVDRK